MKIAFITDTHLGARQGSPIFRNHFKKQWELFYKKCNELNIEHIIHGGDFFDTRNHICVEDINYIKTDFLPLVNNNNIGWDIIAGNHDVSYKNTNMICSLHLLDSSIIDKHIMQPCIKKIDNVQFAFIPWINSENYEDTIHFIQNIKNKSDTILIGHFEIIDMKMYATGSKCDHGLDPNIFKEFKKVLSGHFHHSSSYMNIDYLGAAFYLTWQDYNDWRGFTVYDTKLDTFTKIKTDDSLFIEVDIFDKDKLLKDKFVKINIHNEYNPIEFRDYLYWCNEQQPIKVVVNDMYSLNKLPNNVNDNTDDDNTTISKKTILSYFNDYLKPKQYKICEELFKQADDKMKKGEL